MTFYKILSKKIRIRHTEKFVIHNRQSAIGPYRIITVRTANTRIPVHAVFLDLFVHGSFWQGIHQMLQHNQPLGRGLLGTAKQVTQITDLKYRTSTRVYSNVPVSTLL